MHRPEIRIECLKEDVRNFLKKTGWERKLQNAVYRELHVSPLLWANGVRFPQACWEKRILKSLNSMSTELGVPLARKRPVREQKELLQKWSEMGTNEPGASLCVSGTEPQGPFRTKLVITDNYPAFSGHQFANISSRYLH
ncbi:hypothetical protein Z043_109152 [Scleropages formosus]|uniref:Uncharacterized protein n=1 Tax=Scleropages formosus TaxID=113540 RepID=A0A0P7VEX2_SCLFO|nr:hypothetical protein Z043_109152 [Scleropages formosus]